MSDPNTQPFRGTDMVRDLRFIAYASNRAQGMTAERAATIYPQAASFERMYQDNLGARIADDRIGQVTGTRGRYECGATISDDSPSRHGDFR